jgi:squalene-associated FAD-dependent desaturase
VRRPGGALCVVGGGWAGIAAAMQGVLDGWSVTLIEMAPRLGGRARRIDHPELSIDNGQHILIGAYTETLRLMRTAGADPAQLFERRPLELVYPDGTGLRLLSGPPVVSFARAVVNAPGWSWTDRFALGRAALGWAMARFRCDPALTVADLARGLPRRVLAEVIEPLCVAALNTPAERASGSVFLRVMRDALFSGPGSADLLLPRRSLSELLPDPAARWLQAAGARVLTGRRVSQLRMQDGGWQVDEERFDAVVLACSAQEAARLAHEAAPDWAGQAAIFDYEPIVTVYLRSLGSRLDRPMTALRSGARAPAQFVFDHGALGGSPGLFAAVSSGAGDWVTAGPAAAAEATRRQLLEAFPAGTWAEPLTVLRTFSEKRATFSCTPGLERPAARVALRLAAAGDYVEGPYPATLEGAVRSGVAAVSPQVLGMHRAVS